VKVKSYKGGIGMPEKSLSKAISELPRNVWISKRLRTFIYEFMKENNLNGSEVFNDIIRAAILFSLNEKKEEFKKYFKSITPLLAIFKGRDYFKPELLEK